LKPVHGPDENVSEVGAFLFSSMFCEQATWLGSQVAGYAAVHDSLDKSSSHGSRLADFVS
jgi:hypothetical protein